MSLLKLLAFPIISLALMLYLWMTHRIATKNSLIIAGVLNLIYIAVQAYRYGLLKMTIKLEERLWPEFTCYFKEYNCGYYDARNKTFKELTEADTNMLKSQPQVNYVEVYCDKTSKSYNEGAGHVLVGFALQGDAGIDIGIARVLETLNYKKRTFSSCNATFGALTKVDEFSGRIALSKMSGHIWETVEKQHNGQGVMFTWEDKKFVICGAFVGLESQQFLIKGIPSEPNAQSFLVNDSKKFK